MALAKRHNVKPAKAKRAVRKYRAASADSERKGGHSRYAPSGRKRQHIAKERKFDGDTYKLESVSRPGIGRETAMKIAQRLRSQGYNARVVSRSYKQPYSKKRETRSFVYYRRP